MPSPTAIAFIISSLRGPQLVAVNLFRPPDHAPRASESSGPAFPLEGDKENSHGFGELDFSFPFLEAGLDPTTSRVETLRFDGAALLAEARDAADETNRHKITENSLLTALVWQAYARALAAEAGELVLACPIDFRRISPELSPSFFGNASAPALLRLERKLVLAESVASLAAMISDAIRSCDELTLARYKARYRRSSPRARTRGDGRMSRWSIRETA